jgi:Uma2 family endonuclease
MTDATLIPAPPAERLTFEQFLIDYADQRADYFPDGTVEVHMGNNTRHIAIILFITHLFRDFFELLPIGDVLQAAFPMNLGDELPRREPDVIIILNEHQARIMPTYLDGPADIAIEVVSPESAERDYVTKFKEYTAGGVPEYWLIDPDRDFAATYALGPDGHYKHIPNDAQGRLRSHILPQFALHPAVLWQEKHPAGMKLVRLVSDMTGIAPE